jgi:hypothetical protein
MAKIEQFDIGSGKKPRELTKQIYEIRSIGEFKRDFGLKDQLTKASVSISLSTKANFRAIDLLTVLTREISRLISGFMQYLRQSSLRGNKYR